MGSRSHFIKIYQNLHFYCRISTILQRLVIIKILRGRSSLASLSIALNNNIIALLYRILNIGSRSHFIQTCRFKSYKST